MQSFRAEGIILHSLNYRDYDQILTIFTMQEGLVKAIKNGANRPKRRGGVETAPLTQAEFDLIPGRHELMKCREISVLNRHLGCRKSLESLQTACEILQILRNTQMPGKASPELYLLILDYLSLIPDSKEPGLLRSDFCLDLLRHEGVLPQILSCSVCGGKIDELHFLRGDYFCPRHSLPGSLKFTHPETQKIAGLVDAQEMNKSFYEKIESFYQWFFT